MALGALLAACAGQAATSGSGEISQDTASQDVATQDAAAPDAVPMDAVAVDTGPPVACKPGSLSDLFEKKIKPLVSKGQPTTCNQCHLSGVDLGMFVQDTPCKSMACMAEKGMVDFKDPAKSQVLGWIAKAKPESELIDAFVQSDEHDAFLEWIKWSATCQAPVCGPQPDPCGSASQPEPELIKPMLGGCDEATLAVSFEKLVYKWRDRCSHCHAPYGKDYESTGAPGWLHSNPGSGGAKFTMYNMLGLSGMPGQPVVNADDPEASLLLRKPLHKPSVGGVAHGGGQKFKDKNDPSYKDFLKWIQQFAACKGAP